MQKTMPGYYFNNNICYNRTSVHINKNCNFDLPYNNTQLTSEGEVSIRVKCDLLNPQTGNLKYVNGMPLKMYGVL